MKKTFAAITIFIICLPVLAQPKPGKPVFVVTYTESGKNQAESWNYSAVIRFSLSNWNEALRGGGFTPESRKLPLDLDPAAILKLETGQKIKFYPSEVDEAGSGDNGSYTRILTTDGVEIVTETTPDQGTHSIVTTDDDFRRGNGIPSNENFRQNARYYQLGELAELERTETGAILYAYTAVGNNLSMWAVGDEVMNQVFPEVEKFVFTDKDIQSWQKISRTNVRSGSYDEENLTVKLSVSMQVDRTEVSIEGCSDLGVGEMVHVTATGTPAGGTYRFRTEPSGLLDINASGGSASLTGSEPGRGTLYVEYTSQDGSTAESSQPFTCVKVDSYNNGSEIPRIILYDIDGNKLVDKLTVPVAMEPSEAQELVDFIPGNSSIFTAEGLDKSVEITPAGEGETTLYAKTTCGGKTGPVVTIDVVNCDEETKAKLAEELRIATEAQQKNYQEIQKIFNSEDFERASDRLAESAGNLAIKVGGAIIGSLSGGSTEAGVKTASTIYGVGSNLLDFAKGLAAGENLSTVSNLSQMIVELGGTESQQALASAIETIQAANDFGQDLGAMMAANEKLRETTKWAEHWNNYIANVVRRQKLCNSSSQKSENHKEPAANDRQDQPDGTSQQKSDEQDQNIDQKQSDGKTGQQNIDKEGQNKEDNAEEQTDDGMQGEEGGEGDTEISPPPPTTLPREVSLPYSPGTGCGCKNPKGLSVSQTGLAELGKGMANLGECVETFSKGPLAGYVKALEGWMAVSEKFNAAINAGPEEVKKVAGETIGEIESLLGSTKSFDEEGKAFYEVFNACPESLISSIELMRSVEKVTLDSIKTDY